QTAHAVGGPERQRIIEHAQHASESVPQGEYRYRGDRWLVECQTVAIAMTALLLEEPSRSERLREALDAEERTDHDQRSAALARLSPILAYAGHVDWAMDMAVGIPDADARCSTLVWIAEYLDEAGRSRVLTEVLAHYRPETRTQFLV